MHPIAAVQTGYSTWTRNVEIAVLGWPLAQREFLVPIPGATSLAHLEENAATLPMTTPADALAAVTALFPSGAAPGARYARDAQAQVGTERFPNKEPA